MISSKFFSRMRRGEIGHHHHVVGPYLIRFAQEAAWCENHRGANGGQVDRLVALAMANRPSVDFCGYWHRVLIGQPEKAVTNGMTNAFLDQALCDVRRSGAMRSTPREHIKMFDRRDSERHIETFCGLVLFLVRHASHDSKPRKARKGCRIGAFLHLDRPQLSLAQDVVPRSCLPLGKTWISRVHHNFGRQPNRFA